MRKNSPEIIPGDIVTMIDPEWYTRLWSRPCKRDSRILGGVSGDEICLVITRDLNSQWFCILTSRKNVGWTNRLMKFKREFQ